MITNKFYWLRTGIVSIIALALNIVIDLQMGIAAGTGRDWLIFIALYVVLFYTFVYRWARKQIAQGAAR
jgi:hypothetical protein